MITAALAIVAVFSLLVLLLLSRVIGAVLKELQAVRAERLAFMERYLGPIGAPDSPTSQALRPLNPVGEEQDGLLLFGKRFTWR